MATGLGPDGFPAVYVGGAWVSQDRRYYWNGVAWVPIKRSSAGPSLTQVGIAILFLAGVGYAIYTVLGTQSPFTAGYFVGVFVFFLVLIVVFRAVGDWGWLGVLIRGLTVALGLFKVLTLVALQLPR